MMYHSCLMVLGHSIIIILQVTTVQSEVDGWLIWYPNNVLVKTAAYLRQKLQKRRAYLLDQLHQHLLPVVGRIESRRRELNQHFKDKDNCYRRDFG